jgi:hypothetical protein
VGDQDIGSPSRPVSSGLQVPCEPFPSGRSKDLSAPGINTFLTLIRMKPDVAEVTSYMPIEPQEIAAGRY